MKKVQKLLISALCVAMGACALVACGDDTTPGNTPSNPDNGKCTVTFYDATGTTKPADMTVLKTVEINKGETVESYTPTKDGGYDFVNWFATPSKSHVFDFEEGITSNISIYGGFSKYVEDTRDFYVVGAGTFLGGWGNIHTDYQLDKADDSNVYTITLDLTEGDEFVIVADVSYHYKHGAGYIRNGKLDDGTDVFGGMGSVYDSSTKGANIKVQYSGNYTLTLTTHPNEDYNDENAEGYDPSDPTIKSVNPYDTIEWVRNGDLSQEIPEVITNYYIHGDKITGWKKMYNAATGMTLVNGVHTLEVYLEADDQFMFISRDTALDGTVTAGDSYLKADLLDEASKAFVDGDTGNMTAKATGLYTIVYTESTQKLSVTCDTTATLTAYDYYLDGTIGSDTWGSYQDAAKSAGYKFTVDSTDPNVYKLENITLDEDAEFVIRAHDAGETELGWGNVKVAYNFDNLYLAADDTAFVRPEGGTNVKVATAGTYDITFNSYSKIITITAHAAE